MLDDIEDKDLTEVGDGNGKVFRLHIPAFKFEVGAVGVGADILVEPDDSSGFFGEMIGDIALATTKVEDVGTWFCGGDRQGLGGGEPDFEVVSQFDLADIKFTIVEKIHEVALGPNHGFTNVPGVF